MAFTVIKLADEPIVLLTVDFAASSWMQNLQSLKAQVARYANGGVIPLYVVWNLDQQDMTASDIQLLIFDAQDALEGSVVDPRVRPVVVSDHPLVEMLQRKVYEDLGVEMPQFDTVGEALAWVREVRAEEDV